MKLHLNGLKNFNLNFDGKRFMEYLRGFIKVPLSRRFLTLVCISLFLGGVCYGQKFAFKDRRKGESIGFDFIKNLIIVPLYINDKGPFNFILDTGVGNLVISEPSLVDSLNLKNLSSTKVYGLGKDLEIEAFRTRQIDLRLKNARATSISTAILKKDIFNLSDYLGVKIYGLLGYNFFGSFDVKINYFSRRLYYSIPGSHLKKRGEKFDISIENLRPYIFADIVPMGSSAAKVKLVIDCGASHALSMDLINKVAFPLPEQTIQANLGIGLGGEISGTMGRVDQFSLGEFNFKNVISGFPKHDQLVFDLGLLRADGNLGAEILRRFTVTFDYTNSAVYLKANSFYKQPFEHDMSGIEVYRRAESGQRIFIARVEPDSPAEKAGLKANDEILAINFMETGKLSLEKIGLMLKAQDGRTVLIEAFQDGKNVVKLLKLKRRI